MIADFFTGNFFTDIRGRLAMVADISPVAREIG